MLRYYGRVFNAAPHVFREAWERVALVIDLIIAALVFFNQQLAEAVAKQRGFSPWWVLLPVGLLFVYGIAKANYGFGTQ